MPSKSAKRRRPTASRETLGRSPAADPVSALLALGHAFQGIEAARGEATPWLSLGLTMGQLKTVMLLVETGGMASRTLADSLGTVRSAITPLVDRLIAQKLARREPDSKDRRVIWIRPTTRAMAMHQLLLSTRRPVLEMVWAEVRPEQRETIRRSLEELLDAAERTLGRLRGPRP